MRRRFMFAEEGGELRWYEELDREAVSLREEVQCLHKENYYLRAQIEDSATRLVELQRLLDERNAKIRQLHEMEDKYDTLVRVLRETVGLRDSDF